MFNLFKKDKPAEEEKPQPLEKKLARPRAGLGEKLASLIGFSKRIDDDLLEEIETLLLTSDVGARLSTEIVDDLTVSLKRKELADSTALYKKLHDLLAEQLQGIAKPLSTENHKPFVILVVGVNGAGKTTSIGKMAHYFKSRGQKVMLAAGDTFRAAAVEQLKTWGERNDVPVIAQQTGADSASVIFDALEAAKAREADILIADTAGRLHTQNNLMDELKKIKRVLAKIDPKAPHETMLVVDGGTGQNAISQAREFHKSIELDSLSITKLDGTARGGILFALAREFGLPVRFVGVGEAVTDLKTFEADDFIHALLPDDIGET